MHPVLIEIGLSIRYYGLMYVLGLLWLSSYPVGGPSQEPLLTDTIKRIAPLCFRRIIGAGFTMWYLIGRFIANSCGRYRSSRGIGHPWG
jgi:prolipoprotein diacylglyceryltransferase